METHKLVDCVLIIKAKLYWWLTPTVGFPRQTPGAFFSSSIQPSRKVSIGTRLFKLLPVVCTDRATPRNLLYTDGITQRNLLYTDGATPRYLLYANGITSGISCIQLEPHWGISCVQMELHRGLSLFGIICSRFCVRGSCSFTLLHGMQIACPHCCVGFYSVTVLCIYAVWGCSYSGGFCSC